MTRRNKPTLKYIEPRQSPRLPHPEADYSLLDKEEHVPEQSSPKLKRKRGRPRKDSQRNLENGNSASTPSSPVDLQFSWEQLAFELHLEEILAPLSVPPPDSHGSHVSVLSETDPDFWDTIYPSYTQLPSGWQLNKIPRSRKAAKSKDLQLEYLTANFLLPLYKTDDSPGITGGSEDSQMKNEDALGTEEKQPKDLVQILAIAEEKIREIEANPSGAGKQEASEADWVLPGKGGRKVVEESEMPDSPLDDVTSPRTPVVGEKKAKQVQRCLCFYCDKMTVLADLTTLPMNPTALEAAFIIFANGDDVVVKRMKEDCARHGNYRICRKHVTTSSGNWRMSRNKDFLHDDEAIEMWRRRIDDDEQGKMMTFENEGEEFIKSPVITKRCFYCSRVSRHAVSFACSYKETQQRENLIKALALGSEDVEVILRHMLGEDSQKNRTLICASHFRRSSFITSSGAFNRQSRLRKNEVPIGDELVNKVLCFSYRHLLQVLKSSKIETSFSEKVKVDEWDRNDLGEKVSVTWQKVDLSQMLPSGDEVLHRFCSFGSSLFACLACSVVRRDFIGIMDIRTPGLSSTSRKEKRPVSAFVLWICDNREDLRQKIDSTKAKRDYMSKAKILYEETSDDTKRSYEEKRYQLWDEYSSKVIERTKAENFLLQLKPATIDLRGDDMLIYAQGLEHICLSHGVPFQEAFFTETGYSAPKVVVPGYEKEAVTYYENLEKGVGDQPKKKRKRIKKEVAPSLTAENPAGEGGGKKKKYKLLKQRLAECSMVPDMSKDKWRAMFWNDHDYLHPSQLAALGWEKPATESVDSQVQTEEPQEAVTPKLSSPSMPVLSGMTGSLTPGAGILFKTETTPRMHSKAFDGPFLHDFESSTAKPLAAAEQPVIKFTPFSAWDPNGVYANVCSDKMGGPLDSSLVGAFPDSPGACVLQEAISPFSTQKLLKEVPLPPVVGPPVPFLLPVSTVPKAKEEASHRQKTNSPCTTPGTPTITHSPIIPLAFSCPFSINSIMSTPLVKQSNEPPAIPFNWPTPSRLLPVSAIRSMKRDTEGKRERTEPYTHETPRSRQENEKKPLFGRSMSSLNYPGNSYSKPASETTYSAYPRMHNLLPKPSVSFNCRSLPGPLNIARGSRYFKAMPARVESPSKDPSTSSRGAHVNCQRKYTFKPKILLTGEPEKKPSSAENNDDSAVHMRDPNQPMICPQNCAGKCFLWVKTDDVDKAALGSVKDKHRIDGELC